MVRAHVPKTKVEEEDLTEFVAEPGKSLNGQTVPNVTILILKNIIIRNYFRKLHLITTHQTQNH